MAYRLDINGRVKSFKGTPQGGILAPAYLTRTGVFTYQISDGQGGTKPFRELRPSSEVFSQDSLDTLACAPVTRGHPSDPVNTDNWNLLAIGHVGDSLKVDQDRYVAANVRIQDGTAVADIKAERLVEFSCGYTCDVELTPGVHEGIKYDGIQRNIRYNHVGMGPVNWGRAGNEVRLRVDGVDIEPGVCVENTYDSTMTPEQLAELNAKLAAETARADAAEAQVATLTASRNDQASVLAERDVARGERDAAVKRADALEQSLPERVAARVTLERDALVVLGAGFKCDGLRDHDLRVAAVKKVDSAFDATGQSEDYVRGVFTSIVRSEKVADESLEKLRRDVADAPGDVEKNAIQKNAEASRKVIRPWDKA